MSDPDIVERLQNGLQIDDGNPAIGRPPTHLHGPLLHEAAAEIERLRHYRIDDAAIARMAARLRAITRTMPITQVAVEYGWAESIVRDLLNAAQAAPAPTLPADWAKYMMRDLLIGGACRLPSG